MLAAAGCGGSDDDRSEPAPSSASELTVVLDPDGTGDKPKREAQASCGDGGDACAELERLVPADFAPTPPQTACTEIFGGPDTATVAGTLDGEAVSAELSRANGCEIERFDRFASLLTALFPGYEPGASLTP